MPLASTYLRDANLPRRSCRAPDRPGPAASWPDLVHREVVGAGVGAGELLAALHEQVVEQAGRADAEVVRGQPLRPGDLPHEHQVTDGVLGGPDPAGDLDADAAA